MTIARAVLLVGSAKPNGASTSEALGRYLCARLADRGVATTLMFVGRSPRSPVEEALAAALVDADLFVLVSPLYVDSLPYLVTRAMEYLARSSSPRRPSAAFAAVMNCGFPEADQCRTALDILRAFARRTHLDWAGGLALGEGGAIDGQPLEAVGGLTRHVRAALDQTAAELAERRAVPAAAVAQFARRLIPGRVYTFMGNLGWRRRAARNRVASSLDARPFDVDAAGTGTKIRGRP
jgi:NAD(P)H-dependent FMN reductase